MAVTEVNLLFTGRGGKDTFEHHRTYSRTYEVLTDDVHDDESVVGNAVGIPQRGTAADFDDQAYVVSVDCQQSDDSPKIWQVVVEYDTNPPYPQQVDIDGNPVSGPTGDGSVGYQENPLDEPATWKITTQDSQEVAESGIEVDGAGNLVIPSPPAWANNRAYTKGTYVKNAGSVYKCVTGGTSAAVGGGPAGNGAAIGDGTAVWAFFDTYANTQSDPNRAILVAILNSGKLPFDPPLMTEVSRPVLTVTKNMAFAALAYIMTLKNALNVVAWRGIPPRCAKILKVEHDGGKRQNGITYVTTTWEIGLDPDTWDLRALDAGFGVLQLRTPPGGGAQVLKFVRFADANGEPLSEPVPLDGKGAPLEPGADPVFRRYVPRQCRLIDFNTVLPF